MPIVKKSKGTIYIFGEAPLDNPVLQGEVYGRDRRDEFNRGDVTKAGVDLAAEKSKEKDVLHRKKR